MNAKMFTCENSLYSKIKSHAFWYLKVKKCLLNGTAVKECVDINGVKQNSNTKCFMNIKLQKNMYFFSVNATC